MSGMFDLTGKVAVVTGGSRGIGEAIAKAFAQQGAEVIVASRKQEVCDGVAWEINGAGGKATAIACHIGDMQALESLFGEVQRRWGRLDVLVNNAATNPYYGHILDTDLGAFQKTVDVTIRGYFSASILGGRMMRASGGGSIINVASINATSTSNATNGIVAAFGATITGCTARANRTNINVGDDSRVMNNICDQSLTGTGVGILVNGSDNRIEGNHVTDNATGIDCNAAGNIIIRNTAAGNTTAYSIAAGNTAGPTIAGPVNPIAAGANPWANFSF